MEHSIAVPRDRFRLVYAGFVVLGITSLLPWNLFITAHEYFMYKFRNTSLTEDGEAWRANRALVGREHKATETYFQRTFENFFTLTGSISNLGGNALTVFLSTRVSNQIRMSIGHGLVLVVLVPTVVFSLLDTKEWQTAFFVLSLIFVNVANVGSSGFICGSSMGLAAKFPQDYIQAQIMGQAVAGIATSLASIISQASTSEPQLNGLAYFLLATIFTLISLGVYWCMLRTTFVQAYMHREQLPMPRGFSIMVPNPSDYHAAEAQDSDPLLAESCEILREHELSEELKRYQGTASLLKPEFCKVLKKIAYHAVLIILTFTVSLTVFPAITSSVVSTSENENWRAYFVPVACFLLFNCGDFVGRLMTEWIRWPSPTSPLQLVFVCLRFGFIPLFLFCNIHPRLHYIKDVYLGADWIFILLIVMLSISNGYLVSLNGMYGAKDVEVHEMELAGSLISLSYVIGVCVGSGLSFLVVSFK